MSKRVLIVEDNQIHREALQKIVKDLEQDVEVYCVDNMKDALQISLEQHIHLFLVDIVLNSQKPGDVSGLNFVRELRGISRYKFTPLIFLTSLEDPKLYAYTQLHCFGYIEKPFNGDKVRNIIVEALEFPVKEEDDRCVYFRKEGIVYSVCVKDIIYIQSSNRKLRIICVNDELEIPYKTCEEMLKELDSRSFIQCSRSCIVNKNYIEQIDYTNRFINLKYVDTPVEIGVIMKKAFKQRLEGD